MESIAVPPSFVGDPEERAYLLEANRNELANRGIDPEIVIRYGLADKLSIAITMAILIPEVLIESDQSKHQHAFPEAPRDWTELFELRAAADAGRSRLEYGMYVFREDVVSWIANADLQPLFSWTAPRPDEFNAPRPPSDEARRELGRWLVDRFTVTYTDEWADSSLCLEWDYLHSRRPGCVSREQMALRRVRAEDVALSLADRASKWRTQTDTDAKVRVDDFTYVAVENLQAGRIEAAAAIYSGLRQLLPGDAAVLNNLGFCLLPINPTEALDRLRQSAALREVEDPVNMANLVLACHLTGKDEEALDLAERHLAGGPGAGTGWLWIIQDDGSLRLSPDSVDATEYIRQLRDRIVRKSRG